MTEYVYFNWILTTLPADVDTSLKAIVAERGGDPLDRCIELRSDDPADSRIQILLQGADARPKAPGTKRTPNEYNTNRSRRWEPQDLDNAEFLWLRLLDARVDSAVVSETDGTTIVPATELVGKGDRLIGRNETVLCSDTLAALLGAQKFKHMRFLEVRVARDQENLEGWQTPAKGHETWWQLSSDLILPPFAPSIHKQQLNSGPRVERDYNGNVLCLERPYRDVQPAYLRADWKHVPEFDVATTFEHPCNPPEFNRWLIVSKRFYEFCKMKGLKADWVPVRFE